jgi:hypothetical protein
MVDQETYKYAIVAILGIGAISPKLGFALLTFLFVAHHWLPM